MSDLGSPLGLTDPLTISRFTSVTWRESRQVIANVRSGKALVCDDPTLLFLLDHFRQPTTMEQLLADPSIAALDVDISEACAALLSAGVLVHEHDEARPPHSEGPFDDASYWTPPELALQHHARESGTREFARYRFERFATCEPDCKPPMSASAIELPAPELNGIDFWEVLRTRRSISPPTASIGMAALGAFFHWTVRSWDATTLADGRVLQHRPYPSAGGLYAHEIYPIVSEAAVEGLAAGVYHYCPRRHALEALPAHEEAIAEIIERGLAVSAAKVDAAPLLVLLITSRIARVAYKYDHIAYVSQLKDVGCMFNQFYLVATALGLASCAYGGGVPSALLSRVTGVDPLAEPIVGEFGLGGIEPATARASPWPILTSPRSNA